MKRIILCLLIALSALTTYADNWTMLITCNGKTIEATMYDNATTRAIKERLPLTLDMLDLYGREMTYRFPDALPTDDVKDCGFEKGEIVYYPPLHSFVIMYAKDSEEFEMQNLGYITNTSDVDIMNGIGDNHMTFAVKEENNMEINIKIGNQNFKAEIEDTETGKAFMSLLPTTLSMTELNGNEKYHYLQNSLPTDSKYYETLSAGDLMLYGNSCIVLFYGDAGGYSYTRIGKLTSTNGLKDTVGKGNISVTFEPYTSSINPMSSKTMESNDEIYNLQGKKINCASTHQVYIKDGVKYLNKD